jgi:hypothetical protein
VPCSQCPVRPRFERVSSRDGKGSPMSAEDQTGAGEGPWLRLCRRGLLPELECRRHDGPSRGGWYCVPGDDGSLLLLGSFARERADGTTPAVSAPTSAQPRDAARRIGEATLRSKAERSEEWYRCRRTSNHARLRCGRSWRTLMLLSRLWCDIVSLLPQH